MEALYTKQMAPLIHLNFMPKLNLSFPLNRRLVRKKNRRSPQIASFSKRSSFQDFQVFVKPSCLLPSEQANIYSTKLPENIYSFLKLDQSESFYTVELTTSRDFGSCLSDMNAAIMLCLIDVEGKSLLKRVPAISYSGNFVRENESDFDENLHFRRGSVDIIAFKGAKLGKLGALWVGLESGSWKLEGVNLTVIDGPSINPNSMDQTKEVQFNGLKYKFETDTISLGEGDLSIAELRPVISTQLQGENLSSLLQLNKSPSNLPLNTESKEQSMREYADLKFSLLLYDLIIVLTGFTLLDISSNDRSAYSFLFGGFVGFLYLFLLQRSVDGIPGPELVSTDDKSIKNFGVRRTWLGLAAVIAASAVAVKYGNGDAGFEFTAKELFIWTAGFLACKVAVVLAAFKPIRRN